MKSAIKTFLVVVASAITIHIAIAQTQHDDFAPNAYMKEMLKLPEATCKVHNMDTTRNIKYMEIDKEICQSKKFHEYYQTSSDYKIVRWNIPKDSLSFFKRYVEELTDSKGRVIELRFLENGGFSNGRLCYLPDIVKYSYPNKNTIIETLYNADGSKMNGLECEVYYKTTYKLNNNKFIESAQIEYFIDTINIKRAGISDSDIEIEMNFMKRNISDSLTNSDAAKFVQFYLKSHSKLNRQFPVSKKFIYDWTENDTEELDAKQCLSTCQKVQGVDPNKKGGIYYNEWQN